MLGRLGLLKGRKATCYPGFEEMLEGAEPNTAPVVTDDKFVLGNGPANSLLWALSIVNEEVGAHKANEVANGMLLYPAKSAAECYFG